MDLTWIAEHVVAPIILSVVGITTGVLIPMLGMKLKKKFELEIDEKEQAKLDAIAVDTVHLVEATIMGAGKNKEKLAAGLRELSEKAADAGISIATKTAQAKIEKALTTEGIRSGAKLPPPPAPVP